jgi:hypothetical protein
MPAGTLQSQRLPHPLFTVTIILILYHKNYQDFVVIYLQNGDLLSFKYSIIFSTG